MKPEIAKINARCLEIQDYISPTPEQINSWGSLSKEEMTEIRSLISEYTPELITLMGQLREVAEQTKPSGIVEAYVEGCRLLRANLGGYMGHNFTDEYIPVMIDAIRNKHVNTNWVFLQVLANNIGKDVQPLIEFALEEADPYQQITFTALSIVGQLELRDLLPRVKEVESTIVDERVKLIANHILAKLSE